MLLVILSVYFHTLVCIIARELIKIRIVKYHSSTRGVPLAFYEEVHFVLHYVTLTAQSFFTWYVSIPSSFDLEG